jgi:hypothetical protein
MKSYDAPDFRQSNDAASILSIVLSVLLPVLLFSVAPSATAGSFVRSAKSGVPTTAYTYHAHNRDCGAKFGIVKVVTKPQHGKLIPVRDVSTLKGNRFKPTDPCIGSAIPGFRVEYTSTPGYVGIDSFVIEYTTGKQDTLDSFTIHVQ